MQTFYVMGNPNLYCIAVDSVPFANANWINNIDSTAMFSSYCGTVGIEKSRLFNYTNKIYPNPAKDNITIELGSELKSEHVLIFDYLGNVVLTKNVTSPKVNIDIQHLAKGIYFVTTSGGNSKLVIE
jgi:hypothetical protein